MSIANKLQHYLKEHDIHYRLIKHPHTGSSMESAEKAHIPGDSLAKGVLLATVDDGYRLVVVPSDYHIKLDALQSLLNQNVEMATESELKTCFPDCEVGAVPPLGHVYGIMTLWDPKTSLGSEEKIYFEAGDHEHLVAVSGAHFHELMAPAERAEFSYHI
jgi:Ala-tRNA(Pro) deacylase